MNRSVGTMLLLASMLASNPAAAQIVNVLPQLSKTEENGFSASVSGSFSYKSGNTNLLNVATGAVLGVRHDRHMAFLLANYNYGTKGRDDDKEIYINKTFEHLRYRLRLLDFLSGEAFLQHELDKFRRLQLRTVAGIGPRLSWAPLDELNLAWGTAYMAEYEVYSELEDFQEPDARLDHRWSNYLQVSYHLWENLGLDHTTFVQPRLNNFADFRVLSQNALVIEATTFLTVKVAFNLAYDRRPPRYAYVGTESPAPEIVVEKMDTSLETTLELKF